MACFPVNTRLGHSLPYKLTDSTARFDYWRRIFKGFLELRAQPVSLYHPLNAAQLIVTHRKQLTAQI